MPEVFICYRRTDSTHVTDRLYEKLGRSLTYKRVFKDVYGIEMGDDFRERIKSAIDGIRVFLIVIGDDWLKDENGRRRLDDPEDYVRFEIETALQRKDLLIIPLFVGKKEIPKRSELPESIREILSKNGGKIRPDPDFGSDTEKLCDRIKAVLGISRRRSALRWTAYAGIVLLMGVSAFGLIYTMWRSDKPSEPENRLVAPEYTLVEPENTLAETENKLVEPENTLVEPENTLAEPEKIITNSIGMQLALIPQGEFLMGSTAGDIEKVVAFDSDFKKEFSDDEQPQHRVRISQSFYLGIHEVTRGQFAAFVRDSGYKTEAESDGKGGYGFNPATGTFEQKPEYTWRNPGFEQDDSHPVVIVSWNDAVAFCEWLSKKEGKEYRLPSEAQWEYACRAKTTSIFSSGDDPEALATIGNIADGTAKEMFPFWAGIKSLDGHIFTAPVGKYQANAFGLHDMHGNVWEWCADWYDGEYYAASLMVGPLGPKSGSSLVVRGGSWYFSARYVRSACRSRRDPGDRFYNLGFRLSLVQSSK